MDIITSTPPSKARLRNGTVYSQDAGLTHLHHAPDEENSQRLADLITHCTMSLSAANTGNLNRAKSVGIDTHIQIVTLLNSTPLYAVQAASGWPANVMTISGGSFASGALNYGLGRALVATGGLSGRFEEFHWKPATRLPQSNHQRSLLNVSIQIISEVGRLEDNWDGEGGKAPSADSVHTLTSTLGCFPVGATSPAAVEVDGTDGSISLRWYDRHDESALAVSIKDRRVTITVTSKNSEHFGKIAEFLDFDSVSRDLFKAFEYLMHV